MEEKAHRLDDETILDLGNSCIFLLKLLQIQMEALLLIVVEIGPISKHTLAKDLLHCQKLPWVFNLVLIMSRE
jgi:hypothetical protein